MKILEVALFDVVACGPTSVLKEVISRLKMKEHKIDIFSAYAYNEERDNLSKELGIEYFYTSGERILSSHNISKYVPKIKSYNIVHIHGIYNLNHIILANFLYKNNIPYIVSIHGNLMKSAVKHSYFKKQLAINLLIKRMLRQATAIHVMAIEEYNDVKEIVGEHDYQLIFNGVNPLAYGKNDYVESDGKLNILFLGRLDVNHKGIDLLLDSMDKKAELLNNKLHLYMVGPFESPEDEKQVLNKIKKNHLLKNIISIEGPKYGQEKNNYFEKCDLFIHTSRYEGMPIAVLEAMDAGMPCIVTPGTNMASIIEKSNGGYVVDSTVDSIANKLEELINVDKETFKNKGKSAQEWSKKNLNWDVIAIQYEEMYRELSNT